MSEQDKPPLKSTTAMGAASPAEHNAMAMYRIGAALERIATALERRATAAEKTADEGVEAIGEQMRAVVENMFAGALPSSAERHV